MRNRLKNSFNVPTGTIAGVYVGMEYGAERLRGTRDWVEFLTTIRKYLLSSFSFASFQIKEFH